MKLKETRKRKRKKKKALRQNNFKQTQKKKAD